MELEISRFVTSASSWVQKLLLNMPAAGEWIDRVEQARDAGELATSEEALEWVKQRI